MQKGQRFTKVETAIGHTFRSRDFLQCALTHASARGARTANEGVTSGDNERLEFIGDRVLGLVIAEQLSELYPSSDEGDLARRFNRLVCGDTCAAVARDIQLGESMFLSDGDAADGGRGSDTILADAMEALLGAVFLDAGFDKARRVVRALWGEYVQTLPDIAIDAKTALQEWAQGRGLALPKYVEVDRSGPDHAPEFTTEVQVEKHEPARGNGQSKRNSEQSAAEHFLMREGVWKASNTHMSVSG